MKKRIRLREPFSGLSHLLGVMLSIAALVVLVVRSHNDGWKVTSFAIYGACLIILYLASSLYHLVPVRPEAVERLRRFDQCAIFLLIAGCYTPLCLISLRGPWGWSLFGVAWGIAIAGILTQILWARMPCWLSVVLYIVMGCLALIAFWPISHSLEGTALAWLIVGGCMYLVGVVVFATERPRLWPGIFGFHDLWHIFVLAGSAAHFMMMLSILHQGT